MKEEENKVISYIDVYNNKFLKADYPAFKYFIRNEKKSITLTKDETGVIAS